MDVMTWDFSNFATERNNIIFINLSIYYYEQNFTLFVSNASCICSER